MGDREETDRKTGCSVREIEQERERSDHPRRMKMAEPEKIGKYPERQTRRRWSCPGEATIGAYIDGALDDQAKGGLVSHLADCSYCREIVAETVKLQRTMDLPEVPPILMRRARAAGEGQSRRRTWKGAWRWIPASSAAAVVVCAGLLIAVWKTPQELAIPKRTAPIGPAITKIEEATAREAAQSEPERKPKHYEAEPTMIAPQPGQVVSSKNVKFSWRAVPAAVDYQVRVVTPEGDLVWEGSSVTTELRVPDTLALSSGKYFVLISAAMDNGRMHKANPVEFQVINAQ